MHSCVPQRFKSATVASQFKSSLNMLVKQIESGSLHFVRCLNPNRKQAAQNFDASYTDLQAIHALMAALGHAHAWHARMACTSACMHARTQMRYTGMLGACTIRRLGFAVRWLIADFANQ